MEETGNVVNTEEADKPKRKMQPRTETIIVFDSQEKLLAATPPSKYHRPYVVILPLPADAPEGTEPERLYYSSITTDKALAAAAEKAGLKIELVGGRKIRATSASDVDVERMSPADRQALLDKLLGSSPAAPGQATVAGALIGANAGTGTAEGSAEGSEPEQAEQGKADPAKDPKTKSGERPSEAAARRTASKGKGK